MSERRQTDILIAQYRETGQLYRQFNGFRWQLHSLAIVISGGLIVASFAYVKEANLWWVRDAVLVIAGIITTSLLVAMKKHRYFSDSLAYALSHLEDALNTKRIQRTTRIEQDVLKEDNSKPEKGDYWNVERPDDRGNMLERFFARRSADKWLGNSLLALLAIILACIIINTVIGVTS